MWLTLFVVGFTAMLITWLELKEPRTKYAKRNKRIAIIAAAFLSQSFQGYQAISQDKEGSALKDSLSNMHATLRASEQLGKSTNMIVCNFDSVLRANNLVEKIDPTGKVTIVKVEAAESALITLRYFSNGGRTVQHEFFKLPVKEIIFGGLSSIMSVDFIQNTEEGTITYINGASLGGDSLSVLVRR